MLGAWFMEILQGTGRLFFLPFLYIALIMSVMVSANRIKKERRMFGTRVFDRFSEWKGTWSVSLLTGLVISIIGVGAGLTVSYPFLFLSAAILLLVSLTGRLSWYSPAYTLGVTGLVLLLMPFLPESWKSHPWMETLFDTSLPMVALLLSLLLVREGLLLLKTSPSHTYPERTKGRRGLWIGQHRGKRMTVVPFFSLIPGGVIEPFASWWPVIPVGGDTYGVILIPFVLGAEWLVRGQSPEMASKAIGRHTFLLAFFLTMLAVGSFFLEILSIVVFALALIGREWIYLRHRSRENKTPFFTSTPKGVRILGVIPESPADQMGLFPGELIERVNSIPVRTENQFYEALQNTGAFTKIEVRDEWGENRYVQRAMYEGEHYELGLVFVEPPTHESSVGFF
ncbi:PDZ domain-containing protein [Halobacillus kuroshimensis]|uniref:PDZ domain-containing protein n=1 Tax=Halobacillus kuroshimensis TaxID=302481 RepID=UPI001FD11CCA|nr:PDZ domain-containing protein [Halobacillus kuroshimensis]